MKEKQQITIAEFGLPESKDMEQQVLTDAIAAPEGIGEMMRYVTDDCFTTPERRHIWKTVTAMYGRGDAIDMTSVLTLEGEHYVKECIASGRLGGTPRTALQHAIYLKDAAARRRAYFAGMEILQASLNTNNTEIDLCAIAEAAGNKIQGDIANANERHISEVMDDIEKEMVERRKMTEQGKSIRITTGLRTLDWYTYGGWRSGQLIVLAARPSVGKTALMMLFAKSAAQAGSNVAVFSLEMSDDELGQRLLYSTGNIAPVDMVTGMVEADTFKAEADKIRKLPIYVNDRSRSLEEILSRLVIQRNSGKCDVAFIDYLGLMNIATGYRENMNQAIAKITGELKAIAKRLKVPIVLLCQLNRDSAKGDRAPELYDLRDSGAIEQDADIVLMLETDKAIEPTTGLCDINIWIRKNRQYKKDTCVRVRPNSTYSHFTEIDAEIPHARAVAENLTDDDEEENEQPNLF